MVEVAPLPVFSLGADTSVCAGQPLTLSTGGAAATWSVGGISVTSVVVSVSGLYWAEVASAVGCSFRDSIVVAFPPAVQGSTAVSRCAGSVFLWNGLSLSADTAICVTLTASNGCDSVDCLTLDFFYPNLSLDTTICGSLPFVWQGQDYSQSGEYRDTLLLGGCLTILRLGLELMRPDTFPVVAIVCAGSSYIVGNQVFAQSGAYYVPLLSAEGCDSMVFLTLNVLPSPSARIEGDTLFCPIDGDIVLTAALPDESYLRSDGSSGATFVVSAAGIYSLTVTNAEGCVDSAALFLRADCAGTRVYVPNVFSPNGEQQNDFLGVFADPQRVQGIDLFRVYDRWGSLVFESTTLEINSEVVGWDGRWGVRICRPVFLRGTRNCAFGTAVACANGATRRCYGSLSLGVSHPPT